MKDPQIKINPPHTFEELANLSQAYEHVIDETRKDPADFELVKSLKLLHYEVLLKLYKMSRQEP